MRCELCGTYGDYDYKNQFVSADWLRCQELQSKINALESENKRLKSAISWAIGEGDSDFGDIKPEGAKLFYWRAELRKRAESV